MLFGDGIEGENERKKTLAIASVQTGRHKEGKPSGQ